MEMWDQFLAWFQGHFFRKAPQCADVVRVPFIFLNGIPTLKNGEMTHMGTEMGPPTRQRHLVHELGTGPGPGITDEQRVKIEFNTYNGTDIIVNRYLMCVIMDCPTEPVADPPA